MKSLAYVSVSIVSTKFPSCYYYGDYFMKLYAYQSVRFHNPRPIFTLIGMLFLALDARGSEYCNSTVTTFLAVNASNGAQLVAKNSDSQNIVNITFEGLYLSSAMACGMNYRRCPNLTVLMDGNIAVVLIPLQKHIGLVSYNKNDDNSFIFREKYVFDVSFYAVNCQISTIQIYPTYRTLLGTCLNKKTNPKMLNSLYIVINEFNLSESKYYPEHSCSITMPSEFILFVSETIPFGATIFIDRGQVKIQKFIDVCKTFSELSLCTDIQRFTGVTSDIQAIYCEDTTYLLDTASSPAIQTFPRDKYGLPFLCSKSSFYSYFQNGTIFYHSITNGFFVQAGFLFKRHNVVWGACVNNAFVVMLTAKGMVFLLTVEKSKVNFIGQSQTIPRIFGTTVLMNNLTHAIVYDLYTSRQLDVIKKEFVMGYVVRNDDHCKSFSKPERIVTFGDVWMDIMSGWLIVMIMVPWMLVLGVVHTTRRSRNVRLGSREKGNSPKLDQAGNNIVLQTPGNGSGPPNSFNVNNSPELDSVIQPGIV